MPLLIIFIAVTVTAYRDSIKGFDSYSFFTQNPSISYELKATNEQNNSLNELNFIPHISSFTGFSVSKGQLEFSLIFQNQDQEKKGVRESELFDIQLMGTFNKHLWEIYYQNYHGLYVTDGDVPTNDLPRANSFSYGASMKHFFRDGYIVDRSFGNFMLEKETNWSPFVGAFISKSSLYSSQNLIPDNYVSNFSQLEGVNAINSFNVGTNFGLTGMVTRYGFFAAALFAFNIQYQQQELFGIDSPIREVTSNGIDANIDLGYGWNKNTAGLQLRTRALVTPVKNAELTQSTSLVQVYYKYFF